MCVDPSHLEWVLPPASVRPLDMTGEEVKRHLDKMRAKRAQYQRNFRRKLKEMGGVRSVRMAKNIKDAEAARQMVAETAAVPDPNSISARKARTLARWEAMSPEEQGAAVDQLPTLDQLPDESVERVRELVRRAEALGIPAEIAREYVLEPLPVVAAVPVPVEVPAPSASSLGEERASPAVDVEPVAAPSGLGALLAGARIARPD